MRPRAQLAALATITLVAAAHIGSPDTFFQGTAGPYPIRVIVRAPGVVPGQAEIVVRLLAPIRVERVLVLPVFWDPRTAAAPPPDRARQVRGDSTLYHAALWLMRSGAYGVQVTVEGERGRGVALVPVPAVATRRLGVSTPLALGLGALGALLVAGAITLVGAAARESPLGPGQTPDRRRVRVARVAMAVGALVFGLALAGARAWWRAVDATYQSGMYRPRVVRASVIDLQGARTLRLELAEPGEEGRSWTPLIPDHGHVLHLFVLDSTLATFAHLHPRRGDSATFETQLPPLAAGHYRLYADVVHESGFAETLTGTLDLGTPRGRWRASDPDDAWITLPAGADTLGRAPLADGSILTWDRSGPLVANDDAGLRFTLRGPGGRALLPEPYLGMAGHLVLVRSDGAVFIHIHPAGTISLAAQQTFLLREPGDTVAGALARRLKGHELPMGRAHSPPDSALVFPYAFPEAGRYRLWVQVQRRGRILTGVFDAQVRGAGG